MPVTANEALDRLHDYFEQRAEADDGNPNTEMNRLGDIEAVEARLEAMRHALELCLLHDAMETSVGHMGLRSDIREAVNKAVRP